MEANNAMNKKLTISKIIIFAVVIASLLGSYVSVAQEIQTIAGSGNPGYSGDGGPAIKAELDEPYGMAIDDSGNIYISDYYTNVIRKISVNAANTISTVAGTGSAGVSGDGGPATAAKLFGPSGLAIDIAGNIYVADRNNNRVRKIDRQNIITTVAGNGEAKLSGDGGQATKASLRGPIAIAFDQHGSMYIADCQNNCIRQVMPTGVINTYAGNASGISTGNGGYSGDGGHALNAELNHPNGVALDNNDNLYISDCFNHRIRKVTSSRKITTIAGNGSVGYNGDSLNALVARVSYPSSVAVDNGGNIYFCDHGCNRVRCINTNGNLINVAGTGQTEFNGNNGKPIAINLNQPSVVVAGKKNGNLYVSEKGNSKVRMLTLTPTEGNSNSIATHKKEYNAK